MGRLIAGGPIAPSVVRPEACPSRAVASGACVVRLQEPCGEAGVREPVRGYPRAWQSGYPALVWAADSPIF